MKKRLLKIMFLGLIAAFLGACGTDSTDLSKQINDFVASDTFMSYNANVTAFSKADVEGLFAYSITNTEKTGENTYRTTVEGQINRNKKDTYEKYMTLTITASPDDSGKLNLNKFTQKSDYSKWFKITKIKKQKNYQTMLAVSKNSLDITSTVPANNDFNHPIYENSMYKSIKQYYEIKDTQAELADSYSPSSGVTTAISNFNGDTSKSTTANPQVMTDLSGKITELGLSDILNTVKYSSTGRISKSYYAVLLSEEADLKEPKLLIIYQDTDDQDEGLSKLQFVDVMKL